MRCQNETAATYLDIPLDPLFPCFGRGFVRSSPGDRIVLRVLLDPYEEKRAECQHNLRSSANGLPFEPLLSSLEVGDGFAPDFAIDICVLAVAA